MELTRYFLAELEREAELCKRALQHVPEGKADWKPHEKSMVFGSIANMVANIPTWIAMEIDQESLDIAPPPGAQHRPKPMNTSAEYLAALDKAVAMARASLGKTNEAHLMTPWKLLQGGKVVSEEPRYVFIRDTFNHLAHHRGQMTVYLRLMGAKVPALYGPSADENRFD